MPAAVAAAARVDIFNFPSLIINPSQLESEATACKRGDAKRACLIWLNTNSSFLRCCAYMCAFGCENFVNYACWAFCVVSTLAVEA